MKNQFTRMQKFGAPAVGYLLAAAAFAATGVSANDGAQVQVPSLEVKARIASMEQVNVTAEKTIDPDAPAPSASVARLLAELEELEELEVIEREVSAEPSED